ncbi:MAG: hypothetical protein D6773_17585, partial [Alphaproteobacteria bacterium]
ADLTGDGVVNAADITALLAVWGPCPPPPMCRADLNHDGRVSAPDITIVLNVYGLRLARHDSGDGRLWLIGAGHTSGPSPWPGMVRHCAGGRCIDERAGR